MRLKDKVAIITGASMGIGRADAYLFAKEGAKIAIGDITDAGAEETAAAIRSGGGEAFFLHADVTKEEEVKKLVAKTIEKFGKIDILINNAGIPQKLFPIEETGVELWDQVHDVNLKSVFLMSKHVVPHMKKAGSGVIINMSTVNSLRPHPFHCAVSSAKSSVIMMTKCLAVELAPNKIRVNCVSPWTIDTPAFRGSLTEEQQKVWIGQIPLGRIGQPDDIANAILFLVSDEASWITGVNLPVDGGYAV
jgi:3-oxoacyl-[acyl-carrier protein] reductase